MNRLSAPESAPRDQMSRVAGEAGESTAGPGTALRSRTTRPRARKRAVPARQGAPAPASGSAPAPTEGNGPAPSGGEAPLPADGGGPAPAGGSAPAPADGSAPAPADGNAHARPTNSATDCGSVSTSWSTSIPRSTSMQPEPRRRDRETGLSALLRYLPAGSSVGSVLRYATSGQAQIGLAAFLLPCDQRERS
jgi:hypothetical protein